MVLKELYKKVEFLSEMINHEVEQRDTQRPYPYSDELYFIIFKIVIEVKEVIQTFTTKSFLGIQNDENKDHDEMIESIVNFKKKS